ncbi:hypothetical protein WJX73_001766 [Symbiochloris irregularis]|uniref:Uncharacterized protein n=1 Tax=Symbiochloris irregularis TaxID=706552 RepID=A0AAW1PN83_9CHLO
MRRVPGLGSGCRITGRCQSTAAQLARSDADFLRPSPPFLAQGGASLGTVGRRQRCALCAKPTAGGCRLARAALVTCCAGSAAVRPHQWHQ